MDLQSIEDLKALLEQRNRANAVSMRAEGRRANERFVKDKTSLADQAFTMLTSSDTSEATKVRMLEFLMVIMREAEKDQPPPITPETLSDDQLAAACKYLAANSDRLFSRDDSNFGA